MPKKTTIEEADKATMGSGNVFADIGLENSDELLAKAELLRHINTAIQKRGYTQKQVAEQFGIHQPQVSRLRRGALGSFSLERLLRFVLLLGGQVDIRVLLKSVPAERRHAFQISMGQKTRARKLPAKKP